MRRMSDTQIAILWLIEKALFGTQTNELPQNICWNEVAQESLRQMISPIVYDGTAGLAGVPQEVVDSFKRLTMSVFLQNEDVTAVSRKVCGILAERGIDYVLLKGESAARFYPKPELRISGDVDILVLEKDFEKTQKLIVENGGTPIGDTEKKHFHKAFRLSGVVVELHNNFGNFSDCTGDVFLQDYLKTYWQSVVAAGDARYLSPRYQALSLLVHMRSHLVASGIGLRQFIDWGMFVHHNRELFDDEFLGILEKCGLFKLAVYSTDLCRNFGLEKCEFIEKITEKSHFSVTNELLFELFACGNFGIKSTAAVKSKQILLLGNKSRKKGTLSAAIRFFISRSRDNWEASNKLPILRYLAPVYLPVRYLFRMILNKRERMNYFGLYKETQERNKLFKELEI